MSFEAMFFDLDDTLYPSTSGIWQAIGVRMDEYIMHTLNIPQLEVKTLRESLFNEYGTTFRGLSTLYGIDARQFLDYVHDIQLDRYIHKDIALIDTMTYYTSRKLIFTNANRAHAERVISILGLQGVFSDIIDILQIHPYCKPLSEAYEKAIAISSINDPGNCVMIDDSPRNLKTAHEMGFFTIQVGTDTRSPYADAAILTLADLPDVIPVEIRSEGNQT
jgi:pyrimidine 5'-nucleotidase